MVDDTLSTPSEDYEVCQIEVEITDIKLETRSVSSDLATLNLPEDDGHFNIEKQMVCLLPLHPPGVKLPKIDVPHFNGNILNWRLFWEQFDVAIHRRTTLLNTGKMTYF